MKSALIRVRCCGWTRIVAARDGMRFGRTGTADVILRDPTVSRNCYVLRYPQKILQREDIDGPAKVKEFGRQSVRLGADTEISFVEGVENDGGVRREFLLGLRAILIVTIGCCLGVWGGWEYLQLKEAGSLQGLAGLPPSVSRMHALLQAGIVSPQDISSSRKEVLSVRRVPGQQAALCLWLATDPESADETAEACWERLDQSLRPVWGEFVRLRALGLPEQRIVLRRLRAEDPGGQTDIGRQAWGVSGFE